MPDSDLHSQFEVALTADIYGSAWRYAWRLAAAGRGGCREEAEDLLQEALTNAWRQFGQLRDRTLFKAWLLSIVRTRFLNRLRAQRRKPSVDGVPSELLPAPEMQTADDELGAALAQLPTLERELLTLFYCEGLSLEETGQTLGLSARVVRQRLYRARGALRREWERLQGSGSGGILAAETGGRRAAEAGGLLAADGQASASAQPGNTPRRTLL